MKSGNDGSAEAKRSLQAQLDALQRRVSELTESVDSKIEAARLSQEQASVALSDEQLREVVRLVNANQRAVGAQSLGEDQVRELIQKELEVFAADRLNMSDWALGAAGARILHAYTSDRYGSSLLGHLLGQVGEPPSALLTVCSLVSFVSVFALSPFSLLFPDGGLPWVFGVRPVLLFRLYSRAW
jgi:hypothetical protein